MLPSLIQSAFAANEIPHLRQVNPWADYDAQVQLVLDEYWPETTLGAHLKVKDDKHVYAGMDGNTEVVVKSVNYDADLMQTTEDYMVWINYMGETLSVASYVMPGVVASDDWTKLVTNSLFAHGVCPECIMDNKWMWIADEAIVKEQGRFLGEFRRRSQQFKAE